MVLTDNSQKIMDLVKELTVVELADLVKALEEEFGVSAAANTVVAGPIAAWNEEASDDKVTVEIAEIGDKKIAVIKAIKEALWLGLKEAKGKIAELPAVIKEKISTDEAEELKAKLEEAGAVVNLK